MFVNNLKRFNSVFTEYQNMIYQKYFVFVNLLKYGDVVLWQTLHTPCSQFTEDI